MKYDRSDVPEAIDSNKTGDSRECIALFDNCNDVIQNSMIFDDVAIVTVGINDYRIHFRCINTGGNVSRMI